MTIRVPPPSRIPSLYLLPSSVLPSPFSILHMENPLWKGDRYPLRIEPLFDLDLDVVFYFQEVRLLNPNAKEKIDR